MKYGDTGDPIDRGQFPCRECWEDAQVWYGNTWGVRHTGRGLHGCRCNCHEGEVWFG